MLYIERVYLEGLPCVVYIKWHSAKHCQTPLQNQCSLRPCAQSLVPLLLVVSSREGPVLGCGPICRHTGNYLEVLIL